MAEPNGRKGTIFSVMILGENVSIIGLSNIIMVVLFLSALNYPFSSP